MQEECGSQQIDTENCISTRFRIIYPPAFLCGLDDQFTAHKQLKKIDHFFPLKLSPFTLFIHILLHRIRWGPQLHFLLSVSACIFPCFPLIQPIPSIVPHIFISR